MQATPITDIDSLAIIEEEARAVAVSFGIGPSAEMASAVVDRIVLRMGGAHIYVPQRRPSDRKKVAEEVLRRFNGTNAAELGRQFGLSARHIRRIAKTGRETPA